MWEDSKVQDVPLARNHNPVDEVSIASMIFVDPDERMLVNEDRSCAKFCTSMGTGLTMIAKGQTMPVGTRDDVACQLLLQYKTG